MTSAATAASTPAGASPAVYAVKYSSRPARAGEHFYRAAASGADMPMAYYVWAIVTPDAVVALDTGFTEQKAQQLGREFLGNPLDTVEELAGRPITHVVLSHLHFDHTGHVGHLSENVPVYVQRREMEFWFGPQVHLGEYPSLCDPDDLSWLAAANVRGQLRWLDGDAEIVPGITAHLLAGHTPGSQVLRVQTADGPVVLAADTSHFYANYERRTPYAIVHTLPLVYRGFERLAELAAPSDVVVPGHDPLVMERFRVPSPPLQGRVVRIA